MSIAKHIEVTAESDRSFDAAIQDGIKKAARTLEGITAAWIKDQQVLVQDGAITAYRVSMKVTFVVKD